MFAGSMLEAREWAAKSVGDPCKLLDGTWYPRCFLSKADAKPVGFPPEWTAVSTDAEPWFKLAAPDVLEGGTAWQTPRATPPATRRGPEPPLCGRTALPPGFSFSPPPSTSKLAVAVHPGEAAGSGSVPTWEPNIHVLVMGPGWKPLYGRCLRLRQGREDARGASPTVYFEPPFYSVCITFSASMVEAEGVVFRPAFMRGPSGAGAAWSACPLHADVVSIPNTPPPVPKWLHACWERQPGQGETASRVGVHNSALTLITATASREDVGTPRIVREGTGVVAVVEVRVYGWAPEASGSPLDLDVGWALEEAVATACRTGPRVVLPRTGKVVQVLRRTPALAGCATYVLTPDTGEVVPAAGGGPTDVPSACLWTMPGVAAVGTSGRPVPLTVWSVGVDVVVGGGEEGGMPPGWPGADVCPAFIDACTRLLWDTAMADVRLAVSLSRRLTTLSLFTDRFPTLLSLRSAKAGLPLEVKPTLSSGLSALVRACHQGRVHDALGPMDLCTVEAGRPTPECAKDEGAGGMAGVCRAGENPFIQKWIGGAGVPWEVPGMDVSPYVPGSQCMRLHLPVSSFSWPVYGALVDACMRTPRDDATFPWGYFCSGTPVGPRTTDVLYPPLYNVVVRRVWDARGPWADPEGPAPRTWRHAYRVQVHDAWRAVAALAYPGYAWDAVFVGATAAYGLPLLDVWAWKAASEAYVQFMARNGRLFHEASAHTASKNYTRLGWGKGWRCFASLGVDVKPEGGCSAAAVAPVRAVTPRKRHAPEGKRHRPDGSNRPPCGAVASPESFLPCPLTARKDDPLAAMDAMDQRLASVLASRKLALAAPIPAPAMCKNSVQRLLGDVKK